MGKTDRNHRVGLSTHAKVGYVLAAAFLVSAIVLVALIIALGILPTIYIIILAVVVLFLAEAVILSNKRRVSGIIANVVCCILIAVCILGSVYAEIARDTIKNVQTEGKETIYMGVYVMDDNEAEELADTADYTFGIDSLLNTDATKSAVEYVEEELQSSIDTEEYENMYDMLDDLQSGDIDTVILGESYMEVAEEIDDYEWVADDVREIARIAVVAEDTDEADDTTDATTETEEEADTGLPETFIVYISGIDTYGDVSVKSRSDVNILAVVNTETKKILLLTTPRDYYVTFEATGGAYDKLTHAGIYGIDQSMDALETLYDIDVNYYLRMNFTGFVNIIDAMGGITVYSQYTFSTSGCSFTAGYNTLDGVAALAFLRARHAFADGDFQRGRNQMAVIEAMISKLASLSTITNFQSVMNAIADSFETDMSTEEINSLIRMQLSDGSSWDVESYQVTGSTGSAVTYSAPGQYLSVVFRDEEQIATAKELIASVLESSSEIDSSETAETE